MRGRERAACSRNSAREKVESLYLQKLCPYKVIWPLTPFHYHHTDTPTIMHVLTTRPCDWLGWEPSIECDGPWVEHGMPGMVGLFGFLNNKAEIVIGSEVEDFRVIMEPQIPILV